MAVTLADIYDAFLEFDLSRKNLISAIDTTADTLTTPTTHGLVEGQVVRFVNNGGTPPAPLAVATDYYVIAAGLTSRAFSVSTSFGGSAVNLTAVGIGTTQVAAVNPDQDTLVATKLAIAQGAVDYEIFENPVNADSCVKYLTARLIALSPSGLNMKLSSKDGSTIYDDDYRRLAQAASFGYRVP